MNRIQCEKRMVRLMIEFYCRKEHHTKKPCSECLTLIDYAHKRLDRCKYGNQKPSCGSCTTHCYRKTEQEQIRRVMRYSGPRMVLYHPIASLKYVIFRWIFALHLSH
ncbi:nitrous oxide-stimulated promoter family protein [Williamwhitmania taraxaci]|uniref:nitrous oxide-stimulated promoter family protein n=1 Tax=Williamwhitmania taraxaci TaxID=1640674 RepID=UPI000B864F03|nr:nitrous oxide-stimulated promoter family protein [Williamwhitmania taraxaci]